MNVALAGLLLFGLWRVARPRWAVTIFADQRGVRSHRGLAEAQRWELVEFFERDVSLPGKVVIRAQRHPDGYLRIQFRGRIDPGTRQRIRNFMNIVL